jgi:eukaryotic-like serine/threonine-protein kinase
MDNDFSCSPDLAVGDLIAGKYRFERVIGAGGMGKVVAARHIELDELVAIKFLLPEALGSEEAVARFAREARAAVKIKSEHVARTFDVGTLPNGAPYLVMEYLEGADLSAVLKEQGVLPVERVVEFVLQASEAIAEAHGIGIVHRDLKPANLFCIRRPDGTMSVKVLDFGISKVTGTSDSAALKSMTRTTAVLGSPYYMSPEQLQSCRTVDARTDIWSLGAILFELLSGRVPFDGETLPELCIKIAGERTPMIRERRPEVPAELERVICKCLEKDREQRFRHIGEFAAALLPLASRRARASIERISGIIQSAGLSTTALALPPSSQDPAEPVAGGTHATWVKTGNSLPWARTTVYLVGALLTVASATVWLWTREDSKPVPRPNVVTAAPALDAPTVTAQPVVAVVPVPEPEPTPAPAVPSATGPNPNSPKVQRAQPGGAKAPLSASSVVKPNTVLAPAAKADCDPPYRLDNQGRKHFKSECFSN